MDSNRAFKLLVHPRSGGYTVCAHTSFASHEDMTYYDTECPAHMALREVALDLITELPLVGIEERLTPDALEFLQRQGFIA
jgi:hypothetical protein